MCDHCGYQLLAFFLSCFLTVLLFTSYQSEPNFKKVRRVLKGAHLEVMKFGERSSNNEIWVREIASKPYQICSRLGHFKPFITADAILLAISERELE